MKKNSDKKRLRSDAVPTLFPLATRKRLWEIREEAGKVWTAKKSVPSVGKKFFYFT